jgi:hypothetical protein
MINTTTLIKLRSDDDIDVLEDILGCTITFKQDNVYTLSEPMDIEDYDRLINGFDFAPNKNEFFDTLRADALREKRELLEKEVVEQKCIQCGNPNKKYSSERFNWKFHEWQTHMLAQTSIGLKTPSETQIKYAKTSLKIDEKLNERYKELKMSLLSMSLKEIKNFDVKNRSYWVIYGE